MSPQPPPPRPSVPPRPIQYEVDLEFPVEYRVVHSLELAPPIVDLLNRLLSIVGGNVPSRLATLEARMSQLSDAIAALMKSTDDALARVQADVDALNAQIADLQNKVNQGTATQADFDALSALQAKLDALDPTKPATLPPPVDSGDSPTGTPTPTPSDGGTPPAPPV